ncbi:hypothetical protein L0Y49_00455, partial [bacterium]|nr:hypothetical protein [bacterium]
MKKKFSLVAAVTLALAGIGGAGIFVFAEQAETGKILSDFFGARNENVIYSEEGSSGTTYKLVSFAVGLPENVRTLVENSYFGNYSAFLSPDRKYIAVTVQGSDYMQNTFITDIEGKVIAPNHLGSFKSWSPDSSKVLLYLSIEATGKNRQMYYLGLDAQYYDSGLPSGTFSADISTQDGSIVYSLTNSRTDHTDLYIRTPDGQDKLLVKGADNIIAWPRWSPDGNKIVFFKSDLYLNSDKNEIWVMNSDGSEAEKISNVTWNYPPVWSPDGTKVAFAHKGNIYEYDIAHGSLTNLTGFPAGEGTALHPSYSSDGEFVVFSHVADGTRQIWAVREGT